VANQETNFYRGKIGAKTGGIFAADVFDPLESIGKCLPLTDLFSVDSLVVKKSRASSGRKGAVKK